MKMSRKELLGLVDDAIVEQNRLLDGLGEPSHPQVRLIVADVQGRRSALMDIKSALTGNSVYLKILAGKL